MNNSYQKYITSSREVVKFRFIENTKSIDEKSPIFFQPTFTHQIFGYWEKIYGYKGLKIHIIICQRSFYCYLSIRYRRRIREMKFDKADNLLQLLDYFIPPAFVENRKLFQTLVTSYDFEKFGSHAKSFKHSDNNQYEIYKVTQKSKSFLKFFHRLETLIFWFIDGVNKINIDDNNWTIYLLYTKDILVGYCTVYKYELNENSFRKRISQFLIIPTHQKLKLGTEFLRVIYDQLLQETSTHEITVENPCPEFQSIKDYLDLEMILAGKASSLKPDKYGQKRLDELKFMYEMTKSEDFLYLKKLIIQRIMFTKKFKKINCPKKRKAVLNFDYLETLKHYAKTCQKFYQLH